MTHPTDSHRPTSIDHTPATARTLVLHPYFIGKVRSKRDIESRLEEAKGLAHAIDLNVIEAREVALRSYTPATHMGSGKVEEIAEEIKALELNWW